MNLTVVIPTYNERDNIKPLIEEIIKIIPFANIFIIDDHSPDGTAWVAENIAKRYPQIKVFHRPKKEGLGKAYIFAFKEILKTDTEYILQMDADFSHHPNYIPKMLEEIKNCDIVLCSRYLNIKRKFRDVSIFSFFANRYVKWVLGLKITDPLGGFKCFHRRIIEKINLDKFISKGFIFQAEFIYRVIKNRFKIKEIPFIFLPRRSGVSKKTKGVILEAFLKTLLFKLIN
jgi:dolichol-phosphate mannosyltransferase